MLPVLTAGVPARSGQINFCVKEVSMVEGKWSGWSSNNQTHDVRLRAALTFDKILVRLYNSTVSIIMTNDM